MIQVYQGMVLRLKFSLRVDIDAVQRFRDIDWWVHGE